MPGDQPRRVTNRLRTDGPMAGLAGAAAHLRYASGETITDVAAAFAIPWDEAAHWLRDHGTFSAADLALTPKQTAEIEQRVLEAGAASRVAAHLGLGVDQLSALLGRRRRDPQHPHEHGALTDGQVDEIVAHYAAGHSIVRIAADFGVTLKVVSTALTGRSVALREEDEHAINQHPLTDQQKERIAARYEDDIPVQVIAAEMGIERATVLAVLRDRHIAVATPEDEIAKLSPERIEQILACCQDNLTVWQVAAQFAVSVQAVQLIVRQHRSANGSKRSRTPSTRSSRQEEELLERAVAAHYQEGLPPAQIASRFGIGETRVETLLRRRHLLPVQNVPPTAPRQSPRKARTSKPPKKATASSPPAAPEPDGLDGQSRLDPTLITPPVPPPRPPVPPVPMPQWSDRPQSAGPTLSPTDPEPAPVAPPLPPEGSRTPGLPLMLTEQQADEIVTRYQEGESTTALGKAFGASAPTIAKALRSRNILLRPKGGHPTVTPEQEVAILAAYHDGVRPHVLTERFRVSSAVIDGILDRNHVAGPGSRRVFTAAQIDDVVARYQAGVSVEGIAADFAVSAGAVANALDLRRVPRRSKTAHVRRALSEADVREVVEFYLAGETLPEIARAFGVHRATINRVLRERQIPRGRARHGSPQAAEPDGPVSTDLASDPVMPIPDHTSHGPVRFTKRRADDILSRYSAGQSPDDLAALFDVPADAICRVLTAHGVDLPITPPGASPAPPRVNRRGGKGTPRPTMRALTDEEATAVVTRYRAGAAIAQIAREFDVSPTTVHAVLNRRHEPRRPRGGRTQRLSESQVAVAVARFHAGTAIPDIARALDVTEHTIATALGQALAEDIRVPEPSGGTRRRRSGPRPEESTRPRRRGEPRRSTSPPPRPRRLTAAQIDDLAYRFADGASVQDLAAVLDVEVEVIARALEGRGVPAWALHT